MVGDTDADDVTVACVLIVDVADDVIEGVVEGDGVPDGVGVGEGVHVGDSEIEGVALGGRFEGVVDGVFDGVGVGLDVGLCVGVGVGVGEGLGVDVLVSVAFALSLAVGVPEFDDFGDFVVVPLAVEVLVEVTESDGKLDREAVNVAIDDSVGKALIVATFDALAVAEGDADPVAVAEDDGNKHPHTTAGRFAASTARD